MYVGCKDFEFDVAARKAGTFCLHAGTWTHLSPEGETCANGNAFIQIRGETHLLHVDTASQLLTSQTYNLASGAVGEKKTLFDFSNKSSFTSVFEHLFHTQMFPDGVCHWTTEQNRDKMIVAIFDPRVPGYTMSDGCALQLDVTDGEVSFHVFGLVSALKE